MSRRVSFLGAAAIGCLVACASAPPPPTVDPLYDEKGVRKAPLTVEEAEKMIRAEAERLQTCYARERINLDTKTGNYVFRVWIPADGTGADVEAVKETVPNLVTLRGCLEDVLARIRFPKHSGQPMTLNVPIEEM